MSKKVTGIDQIVFFIVDLISKSLIETVQKADDREAWVSESLQSL